MRIRISIFLTVVLVLGALGAAPAWADHTNPREEQSPTEDPGTTQLQAQGEGEWTHIRNFPPNPGSDFEWWKFRRQIWASTGTLGQGEGTHVGQRLIQLTNRKGEVAPKWIADHGSASCAGTNTASTLSLQHDVQVVRKRGKPKLIVDTTDAAGRCHDSGGGGLEFVDVSKLHRKKFKPREIHLTRHVATSHTVTVDATRPWIVYNNSSDNTGAFAWIDVLDIRSCLRGKTLKAKRKNCRPKVYRIKFQPEWSQRIDANGERVPATDASCHDITATPGRIYCANLNSTIVIDVKNLTTRTGKIRGKPIKCEVIDGTNTKAKVTDCSDVEGTGSNEAKGWKYIGHFNHPGRNGNHNSNTEYTSRQGISVSHEAEPTPNKKWMFVTDERGGGVVPGGASCQPATENPYGNGGVHVFDISQGGEFEYAQNPDGENAVFIGDVVIPQTTFCTAHVMEQLPGEQRFMIAWYSQGIKIVDYFLTPDNKWVFRETASVVPQGPAANTWAAEPFMIKRNGNEVTYYIISTDITRGIDILSWTGPRNPTGTPPPAEALAPFEDRDEQEPPVGALLLGAALLPLARLVRRRSLA